MRPSLFSASLRALFVTFFGALGIALAFFLFLFLGTWSASRSSVAEVSPNWEYEILPNIDQKREVVSEDAPVVLVLNIDGFIGAESLCANTIRSQLIESREGPLKDRVKALFLQINSPGGTAWDADEIYRLLLDYKERYNVPIYAYTEGLCASAAYYIACAADRIYASDISLIGSVGVLDMRFNVSRLLDKLGIESLTLTEGKDKDELNPFRPWKEGETKHEQAILAYYYDRFVSIVLQAREKMTREQLVGDYGAQVFVAPQALSSGYIDAVVSSREAALKELLSKARIVSDQPYQLLRFTKKSFFGSLGYCTESALWKGSVTHRLQLPELIDPKFSSQPLYLYCGR